ncbi:MAG: squalene synthase HpnC [Ideonella sp.]
MSVDHYENFPVASVLCPPHLRPAVAAIYWFARTADDIADEGDATPGQRLDDLAAYRRDLHAAAGSAPTSERWQPVFANVGAAMRRWNLPVELFDDLLSAFEQDLTKTSYRDRAELLDYCRRSANPVGRLLLKLYGVDDSQALRQSDAICSALQLINFWQDLGVDLARGRLYLPLADCLEHHVEPARLFAREDSAALRALLRAEVAWARSMMSSGQALVFRVGGRAGWELRLVVQGGLRILEQIETNGFDTMLRRPRLRFFDFPLMLWRALRMNASVPLSTRPAA